MKKIICDSGPLISLSNNCAINLLEKFKNEFVVPEGVKREIVNNPMNTRRFELKAIMLQEAIQKGEIKVAKQTRQMQQEAREVISLSNSLLKIKEKPIKIVHEGEADAIGLMLAWNEKNFLIDERTTRHLIEDPEKVRDYMQSKTKYKVKMNETVLEQLRKKLKGIKVIRSAELIANAYEKGILPWKNPKALEAALYAVKYAGCSITKEEIKEYVKMLG